MRTIHLYGQSECTSQGTINHNASSPEDVIHIGKGAGLLTWVVDPEDHNKLRPLGCIGELLFEGPLVGCGYLDVSESEKTAAVFIEDPIWLLQGAPGQPGRHGRLYKTGDLVQYNEDGSLTFLGRKDTQVKIRGQRVELGEVEHWVQNFMLDASQVVAEVITPLGENSYRALVAFLRISNEATKTDELSDGAAKLLPIPVDVENKLSEHLPSYMVPTAFFSLRELPTTTTGKVNRKQLRELGESFSIEQLAEMRTVEQGPKRRPNSTAEQCIQKIWARILNLESTRIGLDDSFFHLGGDSITAIKVVGEARKYGISLAVSDIFRHPTLYDFTNQGRHIAIEPEEEFPPYTLLGESVDVPTLLRGISGLYHLDSSKIRDAYPCTSLQEGLMLLTSKRSGNYVTQAVLELSLHIAVKDLCTAWEQVARAMPILRTRIVHHNDLGLIQVVMDEKIRWKDATGLGDYLEADREQSMELGEPLTRYALVKDDTGSLKWFVWTVHHAVYDGWSMRLIMNSLHRAIRGSSIEHGPQIQSFIKYIKDQDNDDILKYWINALADYEGVSFPSLPSATYQPAADEVVEYRFPKPRQSFKDITTSTLIRAAWAFIVSRMTNSEDIVFGATVSGRNAPVAGIDALVAPTFATIPLRIKVTGYQKVSEYLKLVQQQAVDMIHFEQAGLHRIAKMSPDCQRACMFQSLLVMQPQETTSVEETIRAKERLGNWQATNQQQWFNPYALMLEIRPEADVILVSASFDSRILEAWEVHKLLTRLESVMQQLEFSEGSLAAVDMMTPQDLQQIWGWNSTLPTPEDRCAHDMIQELVLGE